MSFTGTTLVNLDCRANGLEAVADDTTITNQQTGVTWSGTTKLRTFGYNRRRQQALLLNGTSSTGSVPAPGINRTAFTAYGVCRVRDASVQQVLAGMNGGALDMVIQLNEGVLMNYPAPPSTLTPPNAALVGSGRAFAWAVAMDTTVCRYGLNAAPIQTVTHGQSAGVLGNAIQVGSFGGGFFQSGEAMQPLIVVGSAQDAATMLANLAYLYDYANWALAPKNVVILTGTSILRDAATTGGNTPGKQLQDFLGPDWWGFVDAVASQTTTMMLAADPARLAARLAYPGVSDADDVYVLTDGGATNQISVSGATGEEAFALYQEYAAMVVGLDLKLIDTTPIARNDGAPYADRRDTFGALVRASTLTRCNGRLVDFAKLYTVGGPEAFRDTAKIGDGVHETNSGAQDMMAAAAGVMHTAVGNATIIGSGGIGGTAVGPGATSYTLHFEHNNGSYVADADVWITSDAAGTTVVAGTLQTNSVGDVTFLLDAGLTYYVWMQKDGEISIRGEAFLTT